MKILLFLSLLFFSISGQCQVIADPAHNQIDFINLSNGSQDPATLPLDGIVQLRIPILNLNQLNGLPSGTCKIKIGLGSKLVLDPDFDLANTNTSAYFNWTAATVGGQVQLTGDLVNQVPSNYSTICIIRVKGSLQGSSTVTTNFLITNHNTTVTLSDENPSNNTSFIAYNVVPVIPVTFTGLAVKKEACNIKVNFSAENEINTDRYEIEASKDGTNFTRMGQVKATHAINYNTQFVLSDNIKSTFIHVRVKSVDLDGRYQYTETKTVKGTCEENQAVILYPNPVPARQNSFTIESKENLFTETVTISISDIAGKQISNVQFKPANPRQLKYEIGNVAAGQYIIKIESKNWERPVILKFEKL